ncbi:MAG: dTDP-4-dehydrorhamnose reductase [Bryobacterales bacterium]|nr:dTDP-4-dehydrorhamnose reductase [Bryobacterales bacterium]
MRKVLIFGSAGQLGIELTTVFRDAGFQVQALTRAHLDITDPAAVERHITAAEPELVINSAAYNMVDVAEQEPLAAYQVNALAVRHMAVTCRQVDAFFVHFSTDYVFDGAAGRPYAESDAVHPLGAYAVSKLAGEAYAQAYLDRVLVVRVSGVFGPGGVRTARSNFPELMLRLADAGKEIRVVEDHVASPSFAPAVAERTLELVKRDVRGVVHVGGGVAVSWYDWAEMIFRAAGRQPELKATNEREYRTAARRPKYSALANNRLAELGIAPMPPLRTALEAYMLQRTRYLNAGA